MFRKHNAPIQPSTTDAAVAPTKSRRERARHAATSVFAFGVALAVGAWAAYLMDADIVGGGSTTISDAEWTVLDQATFRGASTDIPDVEDGVLSIGQGDRMLKFYPGDVLTLKGRLRVESGSGKVVGVSLPGLPEGYTAELINGCGRGVSTSHALSPHPDDPVVKITAGENAAPGPWTLTEGAAVKVAATDSLTSAEKTTLNNGQCLLPPYEGGQN